AIIAVRRCISKPHSVQKLSRHALGCHRRRKGMLFFGAEGGPLEAFALDSSQNLPSAPRTSPPCLRRQRYVAPKQKHPLSAQPAWAVHYVVGRPSSCPEFSKIIFYALSTIRSGSVTGGNN